MVNQYLDSGPDPAVYDFLQHSFEDLTARHGGVAGTTFRTFPSYPQRYPEVLDPQPAQPAGVECRVDPLRTSRVPARFTDADLVLREFRARSSRRLERAA